MKEIDKKKKQMERAQVYSALVCQEYKEMQLLEELERLKAAQEVQKKALEVLDNELNNNN